MTIVQKKFQEKSFINHYFLVCGLITVNLSYLWVNSFNYQFTIKSSFFLCQVQVNAIEIYYQCFEQTLENNSLLELFSHLVSQPCFDRLRTKEQLGYVVGSAARCSHDVQGFRIVIQSSRDLDHVNQRMESFIDSMRV